MTSLEERFDNSLEELKHAAYTRGLSTDEVDAGYALALSGKLNTNRALKLLDSLLPLEPLTTKSALCIVSVVGEATSARPPLAGQVDYDVQARAVWQLYFLLDADLVSPQAVRQLRKLYSIIEAGLNYSRLREPTAHILRLLSSGEDCVAHRVDHLCGLFSPSSLPVFLTSSLPSQRRLSHDEDASVITRRLLEQYQAYDLMRVYPAPGEVMQGGAAAIPEDVSRWRRALTKSHSNDSEVQSPGLVASSVGATTKRQTVRDVTELAQTIETLRLPSQAPTSLISPPSSAKTPRVAAPSDADRLSSWTCLLKAGYDNDYSYLHRLSYWANIELLHDLRSANPDRDAYSHTEDILTSVRDLSAYGGELLEELEPFLAEFLLSWDGVKHKEIVFDLITLLKPFDVGSLRKHYLDRLEALAKSSSASDEWIVDLIGSYTTLVSNLASRDDWFGDPLRTTAFGALDLPSYLDSLQAVVDSAGHIIDTVVPAHPDSLTLRSAALGFYRVALDLPIELGLPITSLPSPILTHICLLADDVASLSEICGLIHRLRQALTGADSVLSREDHESSRLVSTLNRTIIDFVNTLWQKRLLRGQDERGAFGLDVDEAEHLLSYAQAATGSAPNSLGITTHPALAVLARDCLGELAKAKNKSIEGLEGAVTSTSLKKLATTPNGLTITYTDFRPALVEWVHARGAEGLGDLLFVSLQSLLTRRVSQGLQV
ncbi:hypothetical protein JCM10908_003546 [Rhodotorula pacifica]|uniref:uncharacterized protein n=1 Tax=Rhodotorula pacifica TaxID=1495444 RepID=UPI003170C26F